VTGAFAQSHCAQEVQARRSFLKKRTKRLFSVAVANEGGGTGSCDGGADLIPAGEMTVRPCAFGAARRTT
jgi:hypothetical protein